MNVFTFCLLTILFYTTTSIEEDYYWKDYKGEIPSDAFPAGNDENGRSTYIGQVYIHKLSLAVGQIYPGVREVSVPCYGVRKTTKNIKILCTRSPKKLVWIPTSAHTFNMDTVGMHVVPGGTDEGDPNKGGLNIGRVMYEGNLKIGPTTSFNVEDVLLFFPHENIEHHASKYHVLVYNESATEYFDNPSPCIDVNGG